MEEEVKLSKRYLCGNCNSNKIKRVFDKKKDKYYAICTECGSHDLVATCSGCGSLDLVYDDKRAELSCKSCGLVLNCPVHYVGGDILVIPAWY
jgi:transcription elongation factor Elf1